MFEVSLVQQVLAVISGGAVGLALSMTGAGGSILAVPLLLYVVGFRDAHLVIGTTALAVAVTALINLLPHWRAGNVRWRAAALLAGPGVVGSLAGAEFGRLVSGRKLLLFFGVLMLVVAFLMSRPAGAVDESSRGGRWLARRRTPALLATGLVVGLLAGFFGIGGGFLVVPALLLVGGLPITAAIGSSLMAVSAFGFATAGSYALTGKVDWFVAFEYVLGGAAGGYVGALLMRRLALRRELLARLFAGLLAAVAVYVIAINATAFGH